MSSQEKPLPIRIPLFISFVLIVSTFRVCGQNLFLKDIKKYVWLSEENFNDSVIRNTKEIGLVKLRVAKDSLKANRTIWIFGDSLSIWHYNAVSKKEILVASYPYMIDHDKGVLKILADRGTVLSYNVGVVSTGNFVLLMRKKKK